MAVLNQQQLYKDVKDLLQLFETSQWTFKTDFASISKLEIIDRTDLRNLEMPKGIHTARTSGSTGEPLKVRKILFGLCLVHCDKH